MSEEKGKFLIRLRSLNLSKGFTLLETTIAIGLLALAGLAFVSLSDNIRTTTKKAESLFSKTSFISALSRYLNSPEGCKDIVKKTFQPYTSQTLDTVVSWTDLRLDNWRIGPKGFVEGDTQFPYFYLAKVQAVYDRSPGLPEVSMPWVRIPSDPPTVPSKELLIRTNLRVKTLITLERPHRDYNHYLHVSVLVNSAGTVKYCGSKIDDVCVAMGGITSGEGHCNFENTCTVHGSYITGSMELINPFTGGFSCPGASVPVITGMLTQTTSTPCGKKCPPGSTTVPDTVFTSCLLCPPAPPPP